jgi:hypothetical protein
MKQEKRRSDLPFSAADSMGDLPSPSKALTSAPHRKTRTLIVSISPESTDNSVRTKDLGFGV